jgi:hypothetical protein
MYRHELKVGMAVKYIGDVYPELKYHVGIVQPFTDDNILFPVVFYLRPKPYLLNVTHLKIFGLANLPAPYSANNKQTNITTPKTNERTYTYFF